MGTLYDLRYTVFWARAEVLFGFWIADLSVCWEEWYVTEMELIPAPAASKKSVFLDVFTWVVPVSVKIAEKMTHLFSTRTVSSWL